MEILACSHCGKLFNYIRGDRLGPACQKAMNDHFVEVKKYVREHPNVDITTLSQEMKVSVRQIHRWIREERLVFSDDSPIGLPCECCGVTIKTGRYCDACRNQMAAGLKKAAGIQDKPVATTPSRLRSTEEKMRFKK